MGGDLNLMVDVQGAEFGLCQRSHRTLVRHGVMPSSVGFREEKGCIWNWVMLRIGCRHADVKVFFSAEFRDLRHVAAHTLGLPYCLHFRFDLVNRCEDKVCSKIQCCDLSLFHCLVALHISCSVFRLLKILVLGDAISEACCWISCWGPIQRTLAVSKVLSKEGRQKMFERLSFTMWSPVKLQAVQWLWVMWYCCWELITWVVHSHQLWYCGTPRCCWWIMCNFVDQIHRHGAKFFWGTHDIRSSWLKHRRFSIVFSRNMNKLINLRICHFWFWVPKRNYPTWCFVRPLRDSSELETLEWPRHFQYNGMLLGILLLSIACLETGRTYLGALLFCLLLCMKCLAKKFWKIQNHKGCCCIFLEGCVRDGRAHFEVKPISFFHYYELCMFWFWSFAPPSLTAP